MDIDLRDLRHSKKHLNYSYIKKMNKKTKCYHCREKNYYVVSCVMCENLAVYNCLKEIFYKKN